ncbi:AbrB/MazE/SpoVT family DNA-binding domain-containing protein [Candidatus Gracilibacteria bacterium]|nr:AbrB/MazE/SpoVT family DNA-binding domain-containing protein [Candidatus Gracilibacteria bacterium]
MDIKKCENINKKCGIWIHGAVTVGAKGQVVIPSQIRKYLDINVGDSLMVVTKYGKAIGMVKQNDIEELMAFMEAEMNSFKK